MADYKYKIEQWENEWTNGPFYVAFVRLRYWGIPYWAELGRSSTNAQAKERCRRHKRPAEGPWLYSADAI